MQHVAIMKKSWGLIPKILSGEKRVESNYLLIFLKNQVKIKPFEIDKIGFGMMSAWITVKNIKQIKDELGE